MWPFLLQCIRGLTVWILSPSHVGRDFMEKSRCKHIHVWSTPYLTNPLKNLWASVESNQSLESWKCWEAISACVFHTPWRYSAVILICFFLAEDPIWPLLWMLIPCYGYHPFWQDMKGLSYCPSADVLCWPSCLTLFVLGLLAGVSHWISKNSCSPPPKSSLIWGAFPKGLSLSIWNLVYYNFDEEFLFLLSSDPLEVSELSVLDETDKLPDAPSSFARGFTFLFLFIFCEEDPDNFCSMASGS